MKYFILTWCITGIYLAPTLASANYVVQPPIIEYEATARDMREDTIRVTNQGATPLKLFPSVHNVTLGKDGSITSFTSPVMTDQTSNVSSWLAISRARVELAPGETIRIPLSLTVHPQAVPGDYYAYIGFGSGDKRDEAEAAVQTGGVPGVMVRVSVADTKNEYLRLNGFFTNRFVVNPDESQFTFELENSGDTPVTPTGEIIIYDVRGEELGSVPANPENRILAPNTKQTFTANVPETADFGQHKAFLTLRYGQNQTASLYDTAFYTFIPWQWLVAVGVGLILVAAFLAYVLTRRSRHSSIVHESSLPLYVRPGELRNTHERDINLKHE